MSGRKKSVNNEVALLRARIAEYRSTRWPRAPLPTALWQRRGGWPGCLACTWLGTRKLQYRRHSFCQGVIPVGRCARTPYGSGINS